MCDRGQHRSAGDDSDYQQCFYADNCLLLQSFHSVIRKLEVCDGHSHPPSPRFSTLMDSTENSQNDESRHTNCFSRRRFQVCVETWDSNAALRRAGLSKDDSTATTWLGTNSNTDAEAALAREKLLLNWLPGMPTESHSGARPSSFDVADTSSDSRIKENRHDETSKTPSHSQSLNFDFIGTIRGGAVARTPGVFGVPILQVGIIK